MVKKFRFLPSVVIIFTSIFLLINVIAINGLQDWWPSLLRHWQGGSLLYLDVHFFSGPLYPILLRCAGKFFDETSASLVIGLVCGMLYLLSGLAMLNSYARAIKADYTEDVYFEIVFFCAFFLLLISRYTAVYLIVGDYHTLSLIVYCLVVNRSICSSHVVPAATVLDKISKNLAIIPMPFLASLLLLNRFHEGVMFMMAYPFYLGVIEYSKESRKLIKHLSIDLLKFYVEALICVFLIYATAALFFGLPSLFDAFNYILNIAPEAKGAHEQGYGIAILREFIKNLLVSFGHLAICLFGFVMYRAISNSIKKDFLAKRAFDLLVYIVLISLVVYMMKDGHAHSYLVKSNNLFLIGLVILFACYFKFGNKSRFQADYSVILVLSLIAGHVASTSGIYNQSFILFLLPAFILNLKFVCGEYYLDKKKTFFALILIISFATPVTVSKMETPRSWWLDTEPSLFSRRELSFGEVFTAKYPNVKPSPSYASSDFLEVVQSFCSHLDNDGVIKNSSKLVFSYPLPYFETSCKGAESFQSISSHYVLWNDVSLLTQLDDLREKLSNNRVIPDYIFLQVDPWSIEYSSKYFWLKRPMESWPHFKFQDFIYAYSENNMKMINHSYLREGRPITDAEQISKLNKLKEKGCFYLENYVNGESCKNSFFEATKSWDVTLLLMYKRE